MGKKSTKNVERPQSAQELRLLETQNEQLKRGIAVAENQEARSQEQHQLWKDNYLPVETGGVGASDQRARGSMRQLDQQMPDYREDTSGARADAFTPYGGYRNTQMTQPAQQARHQGIGGGKGFTSAVSNGVNATNTATNRAKGA